MDKELSPVDAPADDPFARQQVVVPYTADSEGREIFRTVLWIPKEWPKLSPTGHVMRAIAQLKGQGPF